MRHRVRAIQLKHWKRGKTTYKALLAKGAKPEAARQIAANSRRWWRNSGHAADQSAAATFARLIRRAAL
ncbi:hypothetical protein I0J99_07810 [Sinorhizobium meliloti]|nr:hypothetical protein [Sinorhizobium meliloti]QPI27372.1 hypothetical protein I0J99_07810 [Sinorhizobium meliloti]